MASIALMQEAAAVKAPAKHALTNSDEAHTCDDASHHGRPPKSHCRAAVHKALSSHPERADIRP